MSTCVFQLLMGGGLLLLTVVTFAFGDMSTETFTTAVIGSIVMIGQGSIHRRLDNLGARD